VELPINARRKRKRRGALAGGKKKREGKSSLGERGRD